jgi:hypothetical protein
MILRGSIVDLTTATNDGASAIALGLMGVSFALFLAMFFLYMKRIIKEVAATTSRTRSRARLRSAG